MINDGIILLNKQKNWTSFDCISKLKKILNIKKIGHTGTLDLNATGLLVCLLGNACKIQNNLINDNKEYIAEIIFGIDTDTKDFVGNISDCIKEDYNVDENELKDVLKSFLGEYQQIPPMYSSKKINGKKLLNLAKNNIEVERVAEKRYINEIELLTELSTKKILNDKNVKDLSKQFFDNKTYFELSKNYLLKKFYIRVNCSKGTYIRTLCEDIGKKLNKMAVMGNLIRIKNNGFDINDSFNLDEISVLFNNKNYNFIKPALYQKVEQIVTFGKFECLHIGHRKIIDSLLENSNSTKTNVLIIKNSDVKNTICSTEQQYSLLKLFGIDNINYFELNDTTKKFTGEYFAKEILINQLKSKKIIVGEDCSFGINGSSNVNDLQKICKYHNIDVIIINKIKIADCINEDYIKKFIYKIINTYNIEKEHIYEKYYFDDFNPFYDVLNNELVFDEYSLFEYLKREFSIYKNEYVSSTIIKKLFSDKKYILASFLLLRLIKKN